MKGVAERLASSAIAAGWPEDLFDGSGPYAIAFRRITRATDIRTSIAALLPLRGPDGRPRAAVSGSAGLMHFRPPPDGEAAGDGEGS